MKAVVLADRLGYYDENGNVQRAMKGEEVELSAEDFARHEAGGSIAKPGKAEASSGGWPATHDELDALAEGVDGITVAPGEGKAKSTWNDGAVKTTAEKVAALEAADVEPPSGE